MREFARSDCLRILIIQIIQPLDVKLTRWRVYPCIPFIPCDKLMAVGSICHSLTSPGMMRQGSVQTQLKLHMHFLEGGYFGCHIFFFTLGWVKSYVYIFTVGELNIHLPTILVWTKGYQGAKPYPHRHCIYCRYCSKPLERDKQVLPLPPRF